MSDRHSPRLPRGRPPQRRARRRAAVVGLAAAPGAVLAVALLGGATPARAAEWSMDPVVTFQVQHREDPQVASDAADPTAPAEVTGYQSDQVLNLDALLSLARATPRSAVTLIIQPTAETYNEQEQRDNLSFFTDLDWRFEQSPRLSWNAGGSYTNWQRVRIDLADPSMVQPSTVSAGYEILAGDAGVGYRLAPRTRIEGRVTYRRTLYDDVFVTIDEAGTQVPAEDATSLDLFGGVEFSLSPLASIRVDGHRSNFDEGLYGTRIVQRALGGYSYGSAERWSITASAGVARSELDEPGPLSETSEPITEPVGSVSLTQRVGGRPGGSLAAGYTRDITGSGGILGVSLTQTAYAALALPLARFSQLRFALSGSRFEPFSEEASRNRTDTVGLRAEYAMAFGPHWSAVATAEYFDQESTGTDRLQFDYTIIGVGLRWAPTARPESAP